MSGLKVVTEDHKKFINEVDRLSKEMDITTTQAVANNGRYSLARYYQIKKTLSGGVRVTKLKSIKPKHTVIDIPYLPEAPRSVKNLAMVFGTPDELIKVLKGLQ